LTAYVRARLRVAGSGPWALADGGDGIEDAIRASKERKSKRRNGAKLSAIPIQRIHVSQRFDQIEAILPKLGRVRAEQQLRSDWRFPLPECFCVHSDHECMIIKSAFDDFLSVCKEGMVFESILN
jgi:hypothetical protein